MTTFLTLKQETLRGYRERQFTTGTVASFSTTFIQDTSNRTEPEGEWDRVDSYIKFTSGAPIGVERRVTGWSSGNSTISFAAVPSIPLSGTYQLTKTFPDAGAALAVNSSFRDSFPERVVESFATAAETADSYRLSVPSAAWGPQAELIRVERSSGTTNSDYNFDELVEGVHYEVERAGGSATLLLANVGASGHVNRFHYRRAAAELSADTDTTDEPSHIIVLGAREFLALAEGDYQAAQVWHGRAEQAKLDWMKNRAPRPIRYPHISVG